jgi:hypothetical protein
MFDLCIIYRPPVGTNIKFKDMIERIARVPLRQIWKHEATDFTVWLIENIDILNDIVDIEIVNPEREQSTGNFTVDIKAEDTSGHTIIIENQLGKSDHDHLGKIITYLAAFNASTAIWIVSEPRQEHINAINWLNEGDNNCDFFLLQVEAIKIGDSNPAPLITKIVGPSEESKEVGKIKQEDTERHKLRFKFWTLLLESAKKKHSLFNAISPTKDNWIAASAGKSGIGYSFWITKNGLRVELRIDRGKDSEEENMKIFNYLLAKKEQIERVYGGNLIWDESEGNRMCAIRINLDNGGYRNEESEWLGIIDLATDTMVKLEKSTKEIIKEMKI